VGAISPTIHLNPPLYPSLLYDFADVIIWYYFNGGFKVLTCDWLFSANYRLIAYRYLEPLSKYNTYKYTKNIQYTWFFLSPFTAVFFNINLNKIGIYFIPDFTDVGNTKFF